MGRRTGKWRRRRSCQIFAKEGVCHEHFCHGIWRRQENVSSAMVIGAAGATGAASASATQMQTLCGASWQVWKLLLPPAMPTAKGTLADMENASGFLRKKKEVRILLRHWADIQMYMQKDPERLLYFYHCMYTEIQKTCMTGAGRRFVNDGGGWSGAWTPLNKWADSLPVIAGPESHLHPYLRMHIQGEWPKHHLTRKVISD